MQLKTFQGKTMIDIMRQIKKDLGDDAVIVSSRTQDDGSLRVTAAVEENQEPEPIVHYTDEYIDGVEDPAMLFGGIKDYGALPDPNRESSLETITKALVRHNVPAVLQEKIITRADQMPGATAEKILAAVFADLFRFDPLPTKPYERPIMLVGQPGAGKTTTIAKLAARAVMHKMKPVIITADTTRPGTVEQLFAFTCVLNLDLLKVHSPEQLKQALNDHRNADQVLIDCPGLNAFDAAAMKEMHVYSRVAPMDMVVTIPGGMDMEESTEIARAFAILGAKWLLPTRIDMSRRLGGILAAADQAGLSFAGMGHKPDIADGFAELNAASLAKIFMPRPAEVRK